MNKVYYDLRPTVQEPQRAPFLQVQLSNSYHPKLSSALNDLAPR